MIQSTQRFLDVSSITLAFVNFVNNVGKDIFLLFAKCQIVVRIAKPDIQDFVNWRVIANSGKKVFVHTNILLQQMIINLKI